MVDDTEYDLTGLFTYFIIFVGTAFAIFAFSKSGKTMIAEAITTTEVNFSFCLRDRSNIVGQEGYYCGRRIS